MSVSPGYATWKLGFQLSPIVLTNGLVDGFPYNMLPIIALTEALNFTEGLLSGANISLDGYFANFEPVAGASLIEQEIAHVPFANQQVAANATIQQPLTFSMRMIVPARQQLGYYTKFAVMQAVQYALQQHNQRGGTYTVLTPSTIYTNCLLRSLRDASIGTTQQPQNAWVFEFEKPLITLDDAAAAQSSLMDMLTRASKITGVPTWSGLSSTVGVPASVSAGQVIPSLSSQAAGSVYAIGPTIGSASP